MSAISGTPSEVDLKQRISENMEYLKRNTLRVNMLVSELVSCDLLTFDQADEIVSTTFSCLNVFDISIYAFIIVLHGEHSRRNVRN